MNSKDIQILNEMISGIVKLIKINSKENESVLGKTQNGKNSI